MPRLNQSKTNSRKKTKTVTLAAIKKDARYWFQRWIRLRDLDTSCCYGSGQQLSDIRYYDACHYLKFELYPEAGFDEDNVHGGSKGENIRDNVLAYRRELIKRKGEAWVQNLEDKYANHRHKTFKWDRTFLLEIISKYRGLCKEIESK